MNIRLVLAGTAIICGLAATPALAGSPYGAQAPTTASGADDDVAGTAVAPVAAPRARHAAVAPGPTSPLGTDGYLPVERTPYLYNHAEGTMGSP